MLVETETSLDIENDDWYFPFDTGDAGTTTGHGLSYAHYVARVNGEVVEENATTVPYAYNSAYECVNATSPWKGISMWRSRTRYQTWAL